MELLTIKEVSRRLAVSRATVYRLIGAGRLSPVRFQSRTVRFRPVDVESLINESLVAPDPDSLGSRAGLGLGQ